MAGSCLISNSSHVWDVPLASVSPSGCKISFRGGPTVVIYEKKPITATIQYVQQHGCPSGEPPPAKRCYRPIHYISILIYPQTIDRASTPQEPLKRLCDDASFSTEILSLSSKDVTADLTARAEQGNLLFENKA